MTQYVPAVAPLSRADIELDASRIIARYCPNLLAKPGHFPVLTLFEALEDDYRLDPGVDELSDGVEGMTYPDGQVLLSEETYRGADAGDGRPRFTVLHECYHGIKHREQIRGALTDTGELVVYRRQTVKPFRDPEWQANAFASAVLMPAPTVRLLARQENRLVLPYTMTTEFGVSLQAAEGRLKVLML